MSAPLVVVHPTAEVLSDAVAARLLTRLLDVQSVRTPVHVVLTGGTLGIASLASVAASPLVGAIDWSAVHFWWGDERYVADGDADRNELQAREVLLDRLVASLGLPAENLHVAPPAAHGVSVHQAAAAYADELARFAPPGGTLPSFEVLMLGVGPDAHVASLFPDHAGLSALERQRGSRTHPSRHPCG